MAATAPADRQLTRPGILALVGVSLSALVFAVLLIAVRTRWAPLESLDHRVAANLNALVSGHADILTVLRAITWTGSNAVLWTLVLAAIVVVAVRRLYRLAIFLAITCVGALTLDPILKSLVGRLRPVVAHPVAHGTGNSFPSGHALGSIICYGALLLVFLPALPRRVRRPVTIALAVLVIAIGTSRVMLGVHYLSDVVGAWALGVGWLGVTAYAFEIMRRGSGQPVTAPLTEGLEPESAADLKLIDSDPSTVPAGPPPAGSGSVTPSGSVAPSGSRADPHPGRIAAAVVIAATLTLGAVVGFGELVTRYGNGNVAGDRTIPHWLAAHRTPTLTSISSTFSTLGATQAILIVSILTIILALAITRRWRPIVFVAVLMWGELGLFIAAEAIVKRPRPDVAHLDAHLPTSSYPSGHVAATICVYAAIALLVFGHTGRWWRWLTLVPAVAMPVLVAAARMYRGMHHPTDVLGSVLLAAIWVTATYLAIRPNAGADARGKRPESWREPGTQTP